MLASGAIAFAPALAIFAHHADRSLGDASFYRTRDQGEGILFTPAFAQAATAAGPTSADMLINLVPFALIFAIAYYFVIRPQRKKAKEHANLIKNTRRGDSVITTGGLIGKVTRVVDAAELELEIAPSVRVRVLRAMITDVRAKGEPVKDQARTQDQA
jgi:preprotein translocase subunit YajC